MASTGTAELARLSAVLRSTDRVEQRELQKAMRRLASPLKKSARQGALQILPYHGGLNEWVASARFSASVRLAGKGAGVRITGAGRAQLNRMDDGTVRHPTYGHRPWTTQRITPGWFSTPLLLDAPKIRDEIGQALNATGRTMVAAV
jgi:hypothetical protein